MKRLAVIGAALAAVFTAPAVAQSAADELADGVICTSVASPWHGNGDDVRDIERTPIPQSFRERFEAIGTCKRFQLVEDDLIDWHMRFGSEHSVTLALKYLEHDYIRDDPPPERYLDDLRRAGRRVRSENRPIQMLEGFIETREDYVFLATQYLRAAEEFRSPSLLESAERYLAPAIAGGEFLGSLETDPREREHDLDLDTFKTDDLELRSAVLQVQLGASPSAVADAEVTFQSKDRPYYPMLAGVFKHAGDICDFAHGSSDEVEMAAELACDDNDAALQEQTVSLLVTRALLDLAEKTKDLPYRSDEFTSAVRLLEAERFHERSRCCWLSSEEDLLRLHLAAAEAFRGLANLPRRRGSGYGPFFEALEELEAAESLAQPFEAPGRFRRIAESWLAVFEQLEVTMERDERGSVRLEYPVYARRAAYLTHTLANLDTIAQGNE